MASFDKLFVIVGEDLEKFKAAMGDVNDSLKRTAKEAKAASEGWSKVFDKMQSVAGRMK